MPCEHSEICWNIRTCARQTALMAMTIQASNETMSTSDLPDQEGHRHCSQLRQGDRPIFIGTSWFECESPSATSLIFCDENASVPDV